MTYDQEIKCHSIIHTTALLAGGVGAGLAQVPCSDNALLIPLQVGMIISLGSVFSIEITESVARATLATTTATMVGRGVTQVLCGWIPIIGNAINSATASGITETIGWAIANSFSKKTELRDSKLKGSSKNG